MIYLSGSLSVRKFICPEVYLSGSLSVRKFICPEVYLVWEFICPEISKRKNSGGFGGQSMIKLIAVTLVSYRRNTDQSKKLRIAGYFKNTC